MAGLVDIGEQVRLIREPNNKYDRYGMAALFERISISHALCLEMPLRCRI